MITTPDGERLEEFGRAIGWATNNVAEYQALIEGVRRALELGAREVDVNADSLLVVRQVEGVWRVKDAGLRPLHQEARKLLGGLSAWRIRHVRRELNADADRMVNDALDAATA